MLLDIREPLRSALELSIYQDCLNYLSKIMAWVSPYQHQWLAIHVRGKLACLECNKEQDHLVAL